MADDAAGVFLARLGAGRDKGMEAVTVRIAKDPRVAPGIVLDALVPARVQLDDRVGGMPGPCQ